ncbi:hypothetical protein A1O3_07625, partial [Capronia epimyces CBS 606.96]
IKFLEEDIPICVNAKAKALSLLQGSIPEAARNPSLSLVGAVMLVLSFEMVRGGNAVPIHYDGLARLVALQSKQGYGHADALLPALHACDLILAATTPNRRPGFVKMDAPFLGPSPADPGVGFFRSSPLKLIESFQGVQSIYRSVPASFINLLDEAFQATQTRLSTPSMSHSTNDILHRARLPTSIMAPPITLFNQQSASGSTVLFPTPVRQATNLAATIHFRATRLGIPFESSTNQDDARHLGQLMNETPLSVWRGIPYIYLWILLTGAAAAQFHPEKQYLMVELVRFGFSVGLEQVNDFKRKLGATINA